VEYPCNWFVFLNSNWFQGWILTNTQGMVAVQSVVPPKEVPVSLAFLIFAQNMSAAISIVIANTIFTQSLLSDIPILAPSVSPAVALAAGGGAAAVRALVPPGSTDLEGLLLAFSQGINKVFYYIAASCAAAFLFSTGMGWNDVRKKSPANPSEESSQGEKVQTSQLATGPKQQK
jgi:hypothetical protein